MIIPVKCFTCGKVLADKYLFYQKTVTEIKLKEKDELSEIKYLNASNLQKTAEGKVMDDLGLSKMCCRRHLLTHVDILG
jgi:DNA-directed RNA polymerase subunit N (RpoN/RPB10)|uniref:DNA-directed RNA polymerase n=1 Tax=viral metagenome TaxID=1070528 RepID=A0A6C0ITK0_9ZZZZ